MVTDLNLGDISASVAENPAVAVSYAPAHGTTLLPDTIMTVLEDGRAAASGAVTVRSRRIFIFGDGSTRDNYQNHGPMTGRDLYFPSASIGNIITAGGAYGILIYSEAGTVLPYCDTMTLLSGKKGITSVTFNAWISVGGPLPAGSIEAVLVIRGIEVPLSSIRV